MSVFLQNDVHYLEMRSEYFFGFIISFIIGVAFESIFDFGYALSILFSLLSFFALFLRDSKSARLYSFFVSLVLLGVAVGVLRVDVSQGQQNAHTLDKFVGRTAQVEGIITDEPDSRELYTNIVVSADTILADGVRYDDVRSEILVRIPTHPEFHYGDEVMLEGKVILPKNFVSEDGGEPFDYRSYLAKDDIYYQMYFPKATLVARGEGNLVYEKLFALKAWLMGNITRMISEPESSLAGGITLGTKQSLGENLLQKFRETGVAHIVVLSGYNIAVVAGIISRLVMFMPFTVRLATSAIGIVLFAMMVGGGATVVRATIMALIVILARILGREGDALRALVLAGGLMVFANPMILLHDVSFQLSFSATLALVTLVPVVEKYSILQTNHQIRSWSSWRILREIMVTTFATQIFVLPLILYHMGSVSLVGFIANIFILPVVPIAMLVVALVAVFAWVPIVGIAFAFVAYFVLAYIILAVELFARVPFASLQGVSFSITALTLSYMIIGLYIIKNFPRDTVEEKSEYKF